MSSVLTEHATHQSGPSATPARIKLILEDGSEYEGESFGAANRPVVGEVVFTTGMSGYVETLTDPSFGGQILVLTYPLAGNYGVPAPRAQGSIVGPYESDRIQIQGLVVQHAITQPSHHASARTLGQWLASEQIPGVTGIDTRTLTRRLREHGTMKGWLLPSDMPVEAAKRAATGVEMQKELFMRVAPAEPIHLGGDGPRVLLIDAGAKDNLARLLLKHGANVTRAPWHADIGALAQNMDGVLIGNGPGDPQDLMPLVEKVRGLFKRPNLPIFGVCLGNQILALAAGGSTFKLPYGHRGVNQPVQEIGTRRCFVTSQNHGYAVNEKTLPRDWEPWFTNLNDGTNEGIRARFKPIFSIQFHPEACPGPRDTAFLFEEFLRLCGAAKGGAQ
ncbi:MAG: glutamine-hydrolyzing carbamoyl-phosphate synthase small subunit [Gemmatimonadales bacterium]